MKDPLAKYKIDYPWRQFLRDTFSYLGVWRGRYIFSLVLSTVGEAVWLYFPVGVGLAVDFLAGYQPGDPLRPLTTIGILLALAMLVRHVGMRISRWIGFRAGEYAANQATVAGYNKLLRLGGAWHASENSGNKVKRIQKGSTSIFRMHRYTVTSVIAVVVALPGAFIIVGASDVWLAVVFLFFAIIYTLMTRRFVSRGSRYSHAVNQQEEKLSGLAFETVNNIRTVQTGALSGQLLKKLTDYVQQVQHFSFQRIFQFQIGSIPTVLFSDSVRLGLMVYVAIGVLQGNFEVGLFVIVLTMFHHVWHATSQLTELVSELLITRYGVYRMKEVMQADDYIVDGPGTVAFPKKWQEFLVDSVSFTYEDGQETLHDISFTLKQGKKIGLVGSSGSGKSTLFKLLTRERIPTTGTICIDSDSIDTIRFESYFKNIGVMLQETELFSFSLKENITLATGRTDKKRLDRAIKVANIDHFLEKLPDGVDTLIGEKGFKLSGGERQRVGIARAVYHQPQILFFDEATSHLDVDSEQKIQESLQELLQGSTAVVIAHRLSTIKQMDEILVMHRGRIVERGTFDELVSRGGRFSGMWEKQRI